MKKTLYILVVLLLTSFTIEAQKMKRERVKLLKTSFITDAIDLTPEQAEKFWPIYNSHNNKIQKIRREMDFNYKQVIKAGGIDSLTNKEAENLISKTNNSENLMAQAKSEMIKKLYEVISAKQLLKLLRSERDFNKRMIMEYGRRKVSKPQIKKGAN